MATPPKVQRVTPLNINTPFADPERGTPSPQFVLLWQQMFGNTDVVVSDLQALAAIVAEKADKSINLTAGVGLDGGGDLSADRTFDLADTAVIPGAYTTANITVDAQGRITAAANGSAGSTGVNIEDEGVPVETPATTIDFVGAGVTVTGDGLGNATVTIPGGGGGGGVPVGSPPTVVQVASSNNGGAGATFPVAPTNGNLLVAFFWNTTNPAAAAGWAELARDSGGTDYSVLFTKTAGAGEPTTQNPSSTSSANGAVLIYELSGVTTGLINFAADVQTSITVPTRLKASVNPLPGMTGCLFLAADCLTQTGYTYTSLRNLTQDVLLNTGGTRRLAGGHSTAAFPIAQLVATFGGTGPFQSKTIRAIVT